MARLAIKNIQIDCVWSRSIGCSYSKMCLSGVGWRGASVCVTLLARCVRICVTVSVCVLAGERWGCVEGGGGGGGVMLKEAEGVVFSFGSSPSPLHCHCFFQLFSPPPLFARTHPTLAHTPASARTTRLSDQSSRSLEIWVAMSRKASGVPQSRV